MDAYEVSMAYCPDRLGLKSNRYEEGRVPAKCHLDQNVPVHVCPHPT